MTNASYPPPGNSAPPTHNAWLQSALARLSAGGFAIKENVPYGSVAFPIVAHKSQFEVSKFGNYETFYVFARLTPLDVPTMKQFGADAFNCELRNRASSLPVGFFEGVCCYTVAITDALEPAVEQFVRSQEPPKHWAAVEFPVVFNAAQQVCFTRKRRCGARPTGPGSAMTRAVCWAEPASQANFLTQSPFAAVKQQRAGQRRR